MSSPPTESNRKLRRHAEDKLALSGATNSETPTTTDTQRLLHELQVHQIELEMQNEELRQAIAERDEQNAHMVNLMATYNDLYDFAPVGYFTLAHDGVIHSANLTGSELLGVERSRLINHRLDAFISDETRPAFHDFLGKVFACEVKQACEVVFITEHHSQLIVQIEAVVTESRKHCRAVMIDITARKQAEEQIVPLNEAIVEERDRLSALINSISDEIWFSDAAGKFTLVNPAGSSEFVLSTSVEIDVCELAERLEVLRPDGSPRPVEEAPPLRALRGEIVRNEEELMRTPATCEWRWRQVSASPVRDFSGTIIGSVSVVRDITELKRAEEALKDADHHKNEFLSMLAHELRNPMAPIRNAAEILKRTGLEPDRIAWCSQIIERQTEHMVGIVDDLLDVSRISRGLIELNKELLEIRDFIFPAIESCRPLIDAKRHEFCLELSPEPLWVEGDRIRLTQVVTNLINNAAKYTDEGGRINLSVELSEEMVCIRVQDNGCGIDPAELPHLFDLFYQTDRNLDRSQGGLGIGLSLVQNLVKMHGGNVLAFSAGLGQGSEFIVRLHRHVLPKPEAACMAALIVPAQKKLRILLVDDNRDAAESLAMVLEIDGHQVQIAYDGPTALELARVEWPDVILLDIGLPRMNGYEVAQELRRYGELERTLLIALTGYGQQNDLEKSRAAGFDAHLVKPPDLEMLRTILNKYNETDC